ncbi:MAG TPA: 50S ribosomal protein L6 [Candidatus Pacebacteria bacterium]|nr:50S ribosomal protein L6 [Candidatus Paceibacterota bacterium]
MSRIGKKIINIPDATEVSIDGMTVTVKGKLGELTRTFKDVVKIEKTEEGITVNPVLENKFAKAMWGTVNSHITNMISGVNEKFEKKLIIEGVGYRAAIVGNKINLKVGFSHDVDLNIPEDVEVEVEKSNIRVSGIDKEKVGLFASQIRLTKKPEPYKGKGIRYHDEIIIRKEGKKAV